MDSPDDGTVAVSPSDQPREFATTNKDFQNLEEKDYKHNKRRRNTVTSPQTNSVTARASGPARAGGICGLQVSGQPKTRKLEP